MMAAGDRCTKGIARTGCRRQPTVRPHAGAQETTGTVGMSQMSKNFVFGLFWHFSVVPNLARPRIWVRTCDLGMH